MEITVSAPVYLNSCYDNIEEKTSWNEDVAATLDLIAKKIESSKSPVVGLEIDKDENLSEVVKARGYAGFTTESDVKTDYFYVDFQVTSEHSTPREAGLEPTFVTSALLNKLTEYLPEIGDYTFSSCKFEESEYLENFLLRAYFVGQ